MEQEIADSEIDSPTCGSSDLIQAQVEQPEAKIEDAHFTRPARPGEEKGKLLDVGPSRYGGRIYSTT